MKRKSLAIILSIVLALSTLAGCGASTEQAPKVSETVTETVAEDKETKVETRVTPATEKIEEKAEKDESEKASVEEKSSAEEPAPEEKTEEVQTPAQPVADTKEPEKEPEPHLSALDQLIKDNGIEAYYKDGTFDIEGYGKSIGADLSYLYADCPDFVYLFDNQTWFLQAGHDEDHPGKGFILIGKWDTQTHPNWWNCATYSFVFDADNNIPTTGGFSIAKEILAYLPAVVAATSGPDTAPVVPGTTFKACEYNDAFTQY